MSPSGEAVPGTQSVRCALAVLLAFDDADPEWRASDLARELELNRSTVHRLLSALERAGLVRQDPESDAYRLGPKAVALGGRASRASGLPAAASPYLLELAADVGETATLEVLSGAEPVVMADAAHPGDPEAGPLGHRTAPGRVQGAEGVLAADVEAVDVAEPAVPDLGHHGQPPNEAVPERHEPFQGGVPDDADAVGVGEEHRAFQDPRLGHPGRAGPLAVVVQVVGSGEDGGVALAGPGIGIGALGRDGAPRRKDRGHQAGEREGDDGADGGVTKAQPEVSNPTEER